MTLIPGRDLQQSGRVKLGSCALCDHALLFRGVVRLVGRLGRSNAGLQILDLLLIYIFPPSVLVPGRPSIVIMTSESSPDDYEKNVFKDTGAFNNSQSVRL